MNDNIDPNVIKEGRVLTYLINTYLKEPNEQNLFTLLNCLSDPACGSGSLLLKFAKVLGKENVKQGFYGQEINLTTYNLCRINMFLHDINYNNFNIERGDTLIDPKHWDDEPFDAIVSNPPYSIKWAGKSNPLLINDPRYAPAGILAPESKADLAFTMHMLSWLSPKGTAAIVEYPGVLYREDSKNEPAIRKYLVDNNFVDTIIQLSGDMFFGTNSATCILVLKKNKKDNNVLFIDASDEKIKNTNKMKKATNKFKLSNQNISNIIKLIENRETIENKAIVVDHNRIKSNNYNLSVNSYLHKETTNSNQRDIKRIEEDILKTNEIQTLLKKSITSFVESYYEKTKNEINKLLSNEEVKMVQLQEICEVYTGGEAPSDYIKSKAPKDDYIYPIYSNGSGENAIYGYSKSYRINKRAVTISSIGTIGYHIIREANFTPVIRLKTLVPKDENVISVEFLNYILGTITFIGTNSSLSSMNSNKIKKTKIYLPNKKIQDCIVDKLNKFDKLEKELEKELELRKEQSNFYKKDLLKFYKGDENE